MCGMGCGRSDNELLAQIAVNSLQEAADVGLRNLMKVVESQYGYSAVSDEFIENVEALIVLGASPKAVDSFISVLMSLGEWEAGHRIAQKAGRELTLEEKDAAVKKLSLAALVQMIEVAGSPSETMVEIAVRRRNLSNDDWQKIKEIVVLCPQPGIIDAAISTCLREENLGVACDIAKTHQCSFGAKENIRKLAIKSGSVAKAVRVVREIFKRDLTPSEVARIIGVASHQAEQKRLQTKNSAESED